MLKIAMIIYELRSKVLIRGIESCVIIIVSPESRKYVYMTTIYRGEIAK